MKIGSLIGICILTLGMLFTSAILWLSPQIAFPLWLCSLVMIPLGGVLIITSKESPRELWDKHKYCSVEVDDRPEGGYLAGYTTDGLYCIVGYTSDCGTIKTFNNHVVLNDIYRSYELVTPENICLQH